MPRFTLMRASLALIVLAATFVGTAAQVLAASGFSLVADKSEYRVGDTLTLQVRVDTGTEPTNAVSVEFTYPQNLLEYRSSNATNSAFGINAAERAGNGTVRYDRGAYEPVKGRQLVQTATFKVIGAGSASLAFKSTSIAVSSEDNETNVAPGRAGTTLQLPAAQQPQPAPQQPQPNTGPTPAPRTESRTSAPRPAVTRITPVIPQGESQSIPLADEDVIEIETPVDVEPATIKPNGISKVEYYLDKKLVKTTTSSPYKYRVDTTQLLNGSYRLTTKTYYTNGQIETVSQTLIVKNVFGAKQVGLWIRKYIGLIILAVLMLMGLLAVLVLKVRNWSRPNSGGPASYGGGEAVQPPHYGSGSETVIVPSDRKIRF
ncbi:MAG TPA: Ig-like domain-containing protein [Candidatus Limnocylindrales bacterium]|nr:Ig-like domain-containing protein [Candidatus Limnocylindrales bacterium]